MNRRQFIGSSLALMATAAWGKMADTVLALDNQSVLAKQPWASAFAGVQQDFAPLEMQVSGLWPKALQGSLYRNGPSMMRRGDVSYQHWFDGDGMVQQFSIGAEGISHKGKFVRTKKFQTEQQAGKFRYNTAGTVISDALPIRNNDDMNVANTSVIPWKGELLALWEAGSPYRIDLNTLDTIGVKDFGEKFKQLPFSAHPLPDGNGGMWNFGSWYVDGSASLLVYQVSGADQLERIELIELPQASYLHAFTQSQSKLIFYVSSCVYQRGQSYIDSFRWQPELGAKLLIIDKADFTKRQWADLPAGFAFHFGGATEVDNILSVQICLYPDAGILLNGMSSLMTGEQKERSSDAELVTISLGLSASSQQGSPSNLAQIHRSGVNMEFPQFDARVTQTLPSVYGIGASKQSESGLSDTLYQLQSGVMTGSYYFGESKIIEEPLFIPKEEAGEGYLLMTWLDYQCNQSGLSLFDCQHIAAGPIAEATMERALPLGFHGCFI
ncbi:carotenoid oxygenase family protein [Shewanella mesophila]|nr:carotenoid oxygenase family protein [Shewanella mesophila]